MLADGSCSEQGQVLALLFAQVVSADCCQEHREAGLGESYRYYWDLSAMVCDCL